MWAATAAAFSKNPWFALASAAWTFAAVALVVRLPYGTAGTDEAFYAAMPYGFLLGNKPYQDELAFHQNAAILMIPIFRVYTWLFGTEGIMLFCRWLYAAYLGLCSWLAFRVTRRLTDATTGAWAGAFVLAFSYFNLFTLSYNTLGALGALCGILLCCQARFERPALNFGLGLCFFATAAFSYPTFALLVPLEGALVLWRIKGSTTTNEYKRCLLVFLVFGFVSSTLAAAFIAWITPGGIKRALEFSRAMGYGTSAYGVFGTMASQFPYLLAYVLAFTSFVFALTRLRARWLLPLSLVMSITLLAIYRASFAAYSVGPGSMILTTWPLLAPLCVLFRRQLPQAQLVLEQLWAPAVVSMLLVACTSANGAFAAYLGCLPAVVASLILLSSLLSDLARSEPHHRRAYAVVFASFAAVLLGAQVHSMYSKVYDSTASLREHNTRVTRGPLRGAKALPSEASLLASVDADLKSIEDPEKTLAVFDDFSTAYLSTRMRPRVFSHWVVWVFEYAYRKKIVAETYGDPATQPDFVLLLPPRFNRANPWKMYERNYTRIIERPELGYVIEQRVGNGSVPPRPLRRRRRH